MRGLFIFLAALCTAGQLQAHVWDELAIMARPNDNGSWDLEKYCFIQPTTYTNAVFFDYNNDGNLDLLLTGRGGDWNIPGSERFVLLYRNLGPDGDFRFEKIIDTGFRQATDEGFYDPLSVGDFNHDGYTDVALMSYDNGRNVEVYLNEGGSGRFRLLERVAEGATNGSVAFADIDNDTWLDLVFTGYSDRTSTALKIFGNNKGESLADVTEPVLKGAFQGQSTVADIDGDGWLDIISCGNGDNWSCLSSIYLRNPGDGSWRYVAENESNVKGVSRANPLVADFNNDGIMDLVVNGEPSDGSGYRVRFYYGKGDGSFLPDTSFPVVAVNQDGGINMGDWNGDGNMDIIVGGYLGRNDTDERIYSSPLRVYENAPAEMGLSENTFPEPPASVTAEYIDGMIRVAWQPGKDKESPAEALRYNLAVVNKTTGEQYTMIPADLETGHLKVGTDLQTSLSSLISTYRILPLGDGEYEIGVQTLDQAYAGSKFNFCRLNVSGSSVSIIEDEAAVRLEQEGHLVRIDSMFDLAVRIYTLSGGLSVAGGTGDYELESGIYLVKTAPASKLSDGVPGLVNTFKIFIP